MPGQRAAAPSSATRNKSRPVTNLINRLAARLPHRTGTDIGDCYRDELVVLTRSTLIELSKTTITSIFDGLVAILDELNAFDASDTRPTHVLESELYIVELLASCCEAHWNSIRDAAAGRAQGVSSRGGLSDDGRSTSSSNGYHSEMGGIQNSLLQTRRMQSTQNALNTHGIVPSSLEDPFVLHILNLLAGMMNPISDDEEPPSSMLLDLGAGTEIGIMKVLGGDPCAQSDEGRPERVKRASSEIIEYLSASNWSVVFNFLQNKLKALRSSGSKSATIDAPDRDEQVALAGLQVMARVWVNRRKLSVIIQELCGCFLNLRKSAQNAVTLLLPDTIGRWLSNNPAEFIQLHTKEKRMDQWPDFLFDMASTMVNDVRLKEYLWPFQTSLILLIPEVFRVAGNMRDAKGSGNVAKKAAFLEGLRKSLRSARSSSTAAFCLIGICRVAHFFPSDSDAALLSYALDVQHEVRERVFDLSPSSEDKSVDLQLMIAAFVSLCHLSLPSVLEHLIPRSFDDDSLTSFTLAVFQACEIMAMQPDADDYQPLFEAAGPLCRAYLAWTLNSKIHSARTGRHGGGNDDDMISAILCTMFRFLSNRPSVLFEGTPADPDEYNEEFNQGLAAFLPFLASDNESIRSLACRVARQTVAHSVSLVATQREKAGSDQFLLLQWWRSTSMILSTLASKAIDPNLEPSELKTMVYCIEDYLRTRMQILKTHKKFYTGLDGETEIPERSSASSNLEVLFLVLLCSSDLAICAATRSSIALLCEEGNLTENMADSGRSFLTIMRNHDAYSELSSPDIRLTGVVAFQKGFRKALGKMSKPTSALLSAWETVFSRWHVINRQLLDVRFTAPPDIDEESFLEWRNYSGFLASLGGSCVSEPYARSEDILFTGLHWIDRRPSEDDEQCLLDNFMIQCIELLGCNYIRGREAMREVLGTELDPKLYPVLLRFLESHLNRIFNDAASTSSVESRIAFAEQAASLLRSIVDRLDDAHDTSNLANFGQLSLDLARFLQSVRVDPTSLRVKIKICQLCETVTRKRETLKLGHDVRVRNQLLATLSNWMARPDALGADGNSIFFGPRVDKAILLQRDLDRACLRALVELTYGLPLQPLDVQSDADTSESKSSLFHDYFDRFLALLFVDAAGHERRNDSDESSSTIELAITALSNLLSANIDVGLKQSLEIGYHQDTGIRTAFLRVLCNILDQEMEYERLSDAVISERYNTLIDLFLNDMNLTIALCDSCPSSDVDEVSLAVMNIFDSRGRGFDLVQALIEHEVANTVTESELLRRNCVATKILGYYGKWKGSHYLKSTLSQVVHRLIQSSEEVHLELDPTRTADTEELQRNVLQLRYVTKVFIDDICKSVDKVPPTLRRICYIIATVVTTRFPDAKYTAVGAFIFLRFFCPAIVAPEVEGLVATAPNKDMRRGLLLIAKVAQNLANNVLFGAKEPYMFPLNEFLAYNIFKVTAFLREISAPATFPGPEILMDPFDFGSCVTLHRFLYDHWDTVRQKVLIRERQSWKDAAMPASLDTAPSQLSNSVDKVGGLISVLGPPTTDISWNRPQISANMPPTYCRFQQFMLKNAGRNAESSISTNAIYDGGQSKDDLPVICIILRNIDLDGTDRDLLLYCYLKYASRMWHRPFGLLVDATYYNNMTEPQDDLFHKLQALCPWELSKNLSRIYVYNMNSAYKKCFRRVLRLAAKDKHSSFHPNMVDYHLLGSLQELQGHFQLSQLHLPKDTISVVNDSRFLFQPALRISKTKGKIEVVIKIGSQYVQVTTTKKQDIVPGIRLSATINDIFRLADVDEANAPGQSEDETAFGLRTENGKIVMYFTSPRKVEILQAIQSAKTKLSRSGKPTGSLQLLVRPEDVPGTLLNISLMNLASNDKVLRLTAYNLLCSLCRAFRFSVASQFVTAKELHIPASSVGILVDVSTRLAKSEPQLTSDFLSEYFLGWDRMPTQARPLHVLYMVPWLSNLRRHVLLPDSDNEKGKEKVALIARKLIDITMHEAALSTCFQQSVWPAIAKEEALMDVFLDEMVKRSLTFDPKMDRSDVIASIAASLGSVNMQGKLIARLRKVLNRSSLRPTRLLADNAVWPEICVLLRICVATSFDSRAQPQLFLPELFHIITMVVNSGSSAIRVLVHNLLTTTVHSLCASSVLEEVSLNKLKMALAALSDPKSKLLFTLHPTEGGRALSKTQDSDGTTCASLQAIVQLMLDIISLGAPTADIANAWRARWMSLVATTAFQSNPAIQPRAFAVMGCLARDDVDDDLLYQVMVSLRTAISRFGTDGDGELLIAIVSTLTNMMTRLPTSSRYILQLFWLAMSLVRLASPVMFDSAASFLDSVLHAIAASGGFKDGKMTSTLLQGALSIDEATREIDALYGVRFRQDTFHFASSACLLKGLADPVTKVTALRTLSSFLEIASASASGDRRFPRDISVLPYLGLVAARATTVDESREILWLTGNSPQYVIESQLDVYSMVDLDDIPAEELLLNAILSIVDFASCEDTIQQRTLRFLDGVATRRPSVLVHLYEPVSSLLNDVLLSSQIPATLEAAHSLTRALSSQPQFSNSTVVSRKLGELLEEAGLSGIWQTSSFEGTGQQQRACASLVDKLIELIIA